MGGCLIFFFQKDLVYYPSKQDFDNCENFTEAEKLNVNGTRIYFKKNSKDKVFVFYHGNAGATCDRGYWKNYLDQLSYSYVMVEYAGYSNDSKKPDKELIMKDVENTVDFLKKQNFKNILVGGESLGTSLAIYHSDLMDVDKLLLVSPFYRLNDVAQIAFKGYPINLISRQNYDSGKWMETSKTKDLVIIHGEKDTTIPIDQAKKLYGVAKMNKELVEIPGAGHNDIYLFDKVQEVIGNFLNYQKYW